MSLELRITFRGSAPGLQMHRLSVGAFGRALERLLLALQRTASGVLSGSNSFGAGRIAGEARGLDLELLRLEDNCVSLVFNAANRDPSPVASGELAEMALKRLLEDIEAEVKGDDRNIAVRRYVQALPAGLATQSYTVARNGEVLAEMTCGTVEHVEESDAPKLVQFAGTIISVGFPPGTAYVSVRSGDRNIRINCTAEQVDAAWALRSRRVRVAALLGRESRLMWVRADDDPSNERRSIQSAIDHVQSTWQHTLNILAQ